MFFNSETCESPFRGTTRCWFGSAPRRSARPITSCGDSTSPPGSGCPCGWRSASAGLDDVCSGRSSPVTSTRLARRSASLRKGDRVFAATGIPLGAYAEYICLRENPQTGAIATMPANLDYAEAAAVPYGGGEALSFLRKADVRSGQRVLVNGAGGSFGTFAVQIAKVLGAHVTAVDSAPNWRCCARSARIASSTTPGRTSPPAPRPTTSSSTWSAAHRPLAW